MAATHKCLGAARADTAVPTSSNLGGVRRCPRGMQAAHPRECEWTVTVERYPGAGERARARARAREPVPGPSL